MLDYPVLLLFPAAMAFAAASDVLTYTIPNRVSLALIAGFCVAAPLAGLGMHGTLMHLAAGASVLAVCIAMFAMRLVGGGDAKLLAAGALWMGFDHLIPFLAYTAVIGGALALTILVFRRLATTALIAQPWVQRLHAAESGIPYGVAIAGGALLVYPKTPIFLGLIA